MILVESERRVGRKGAEKMVSVSTRCYLSSLPSGVGSAAQALRAIRGHWGHRYVTMGIENRLHWVLDVVFREDESRIRKNHAPENMATLRKWALNLLRRETRETVGRKAKRLRAGWDEEYLKKILAG